MNSLLKKLFFLRCLEYLIITQDSKIIEMSSGVERFAAIPKVVKPGKDVRVGFPELIGLENVFNAILSSEQENFEIKGVARSRDTSPLYINIYIINIPETHSSNQLIIFIEDVTEQMVLEQSLVQSVNETNLLLSNLTVTNQYIDKIITSMADALLVTTPSGKIKTINLAAQTMLEYESAELQGKPISSIMMGTLQVEKEVETVCQTKSGKKIPVAFSCSMVQTEIEHLQGYVYILRDITERKQLELAKQEFLAMISHEVRTPMISVIGMASLLLETELSAQQQDFVETINTSGNALLKIINDFLDFSKFESGKIELEEQPFNLQSCINEALCIVTPTAKEKGLQLTFNDGGKLPTMIVGDINRLRQILINLLNNAIKFTETGKVEVSVLSQHTRENIYEFQFAVRDTGIGIPSARQERLFKAFSQVNSSITRQYGGTGLGLAICQKLSESMGGRIWVESEPGLGSTFYFTINAVVIQSGVVDVAYNTIAIRNIAEQHPLRILLVEDLKINQKVTQLMLQRIGYQAAIANNGLEALLALQSQPYDVVLMDVQMPEMDGITTTQHIIAEFPDVSRPRIIALTASAIWADRDRCLASGMDDYLAKPFQIEELIQVLLKCQPPSPIDSAALLELQRIADFNPEVNPKEFLLEFIADYLEEAPKFLQDIRVALNQGDFKTLRRLAHTFSSTSATLGANTLATHCAELEVMTATEVIAGVSEQIATIEAEYQLVETALRKQYLVYDTLRECQNATPYSGVAPYL